MLSKLMLAGPNVLMLDGPTDHLDLESISAVNDGLIKFAGNILFSTHDHEFIQTVANRVIQIDGGIKYDKWTSYDEFLAEH